MEKLPGPAVSACRSAIAASSHQVQLLRSRSDAIVVGINTVLNDDPTLLPRDVPMLRPYRRIVLDRNLRLPLDSQLVKTIDRGEVIVCSPIESTVSKSHRIVRSRRANDRHRGLVER